MAAVPLITVRAANKKRINEQDLEPSNVAHKKQKIIGEVIGCASVIFEQMGVPMGKIVGCQSTGKTSTLLALLGCKGLAVVNNSIGTRCPVSYVVHHNEELQQLNFHLSILKDGKEELMLKSDNSQDIRQAVEKHWKSYADSSVDYSESLIVRIKDKQAFPMEVQDAPGYNGIAAVKGFHSKEFQIASYADLHIETTRPCLLFVTHKAHEEAGNNTLIPELWSRTKHMVILITHIDKLDNNRDIGLLLKSCALWFSKAKQHDTCLRICFLHVSKGENTMVSLQEEEATLKRYEDVTKSDTNRGLYLMGIPALREYIQDAWLSGISIEKLRKCEADLTRKITTVDRQIKSAEVHHSRNYLSTTVRDFITDAKNSLSVEAPLTQFFQQQLEHCFVEYFENHPMVESPSVASTNKGNKILSYVRRFAMTLVLPRAVEEYQVFTRKKQYLIRALTVAAPKFAQEMADSTINLMKANLLEIVSKDPVISASDRLRNMATQTIETSVSRAASEVDLQTDLCKHMSLAEHLVESTMFFDVDMQDSYGDSSNSGLLQHMSDIFRHWELCYRGLIGEMLKFISDEVYCQINLMSSACLSSEDITEMKYTLKLLQQSLKATKTFNLFMTEYLANKVHAAHSGWFSFPKFHFVKLQ